MRKIVKEALSAARKGSETDLSDLVIPKLAAAGPISRAAGDEGDYVRSFLWSDGSVDRDNDTIRAKGWQLKRFRKNGAILWAHNGRLPPVGEPKGFKVEGPGDEAKLVGDIRFPADEALFGNLLLRLIDERILKNVSVGFMPLKWQHNEERGGIDFIDQELVEGSLVPVGAHPDAMVQLAGAEGLDLAPMRDWAEKWLDGDEETVTCALDDGEVWQIYKGLANVSVPVVASIEPEKPEEAAEPAKAAEPEEPDTRTPHEIVEDQVRQLAADIEAGELPDDAKLAISAAIDDVMAELQKRPISYNAAHRGGTPLAPRDQTWNGQREIAAAEVSDLQVMSAWVDAGSAEQKGAYKLPHHVAAGEHSLVWRGLTAAMGALLGARGGVDVSDGDRRGIYNHLARHYREFDEEPPELRAYCGDELKDIEEQPSADITPERVAEMVREAWRQASEKDITVERFREILEEELAEFKAEYLRESGRLPV